jgi:hypothetical protein
VRTALAFRDWTADLPFQQPAWSLTLPHGWSLVNVKRSAPSTEDTYRGSAASVADRVGRRPGGTATAGGRIGMSETQGFVDSKMPLPSTSRP